VTQAGSSVEGPAGTDLSATITEASGTAQWTCVGSYGRPLNHLLWGAGGAIYYGPINHPWMSNVSYHVADRVSSGGTLYECSTAISGSTTAPAGDAAHWVVVGALPGWYTTSNVWDQDSFDVARWVRYLDPYNAEEGLYDENTRVRSMGLRRIAYEGGPDMNSPTQITAATVDGVLHDTRMRQAILDHHRAWEEQGGQAVFYFTAVGRPVINAVSGETFGWALDLSQANAQGGAGRPPKLEAYDDLLAAKPYAPIIGTPMDGTSIPGNHFAQSAEAAAGPFTGGWNWRGNVFDAGTPQHRWSAFLFRADAPAARTLRLNVAAGGATADVYFDGKKIAPAIVLAAGDNDLSVGAVVADLHSVVVVAKTGTFTLNHLSMF
jgi:hypothetical protein